MNVAYIAYINGPKSTPPPNYFAPSQWRESLEQQFLLLPEIADLNAHIQTLRSAQKTAATPRCKPLHASELHEFKLARQCKWMIYLESAVCKALDEAMRMAAYPPDTLVVAALPEFFWRDINDNLKHTGLTKKDGIPGYGKPFYAPVFDALSSNAQTLSAADVPKTLCELTWKYPNLIVFAGTVWWKKIVNVACNGCGGISEPVCKQCFKQSETMFNTLPVFYQGKRILLWNKQYVSDIDGLGTLSDQFQKRASRQFEKSAFSAAPKPAVTAPAGSWSVIGLPATTALSTEPYFQITHAGKKITFSMDICLDFMQGYDRRGITTTAGPMSKDIWTSNLHAGMPDIQMLIAGGMPINKKNSGNIFASHYLLRCDAICQDKGAFAEVWEPGKTAPTAALPEPAAGANPFMASDPYPL